jgi:hypothetical protein
LVSRWLDPSHNHSTTGPRRLTKEFALVQASDKKGLFWCGPSAWYLETTTGCMGDNLNIRTLSIRGAATIDVMVVAKNDEIF